MCEFYILYIYCEWHVSELIEVLIREIILRVFSPFRFNAGFGCHASTTSAKPNIHGSKLLLCIRWDQQGVIYYELLETNETIAGDRYRLQLMRLSRSLKEKRPLYAQRRDKVN